MQPELKRRGRADRAARARLLLKAQLGWLGGYPTGAERGRVSWRVAEPGRPNRVIPGDAVSDREGTVRWGPRVIDRAAIASATRAFKRLLGEHRRALPALVGDVEDWTRGVEAALAALKAVVHRGAELGDVFDSYPAPLAARARRIGTARPVLGPLLAALSWADLSAPAGLARDLRILERHQAAFARLIELSGEVAIDAGLRLVGLARAEESRVAGLMRLLADPDLPFTPTAFGEYPDQIKRRLEGAEITIGPRPSAVLAPVVLELIDWIAAAPPPVRRAALRAITAADLPRYLGRWRLLWTALEPAEALARRSREAIDRAAHDHMFRCRASLTWITELAPTPLKAASLRHAITRLAAADARPLVALVAGAPDLDDLPAGIEVMGGIALEVELLDRPAQVSALVGLLRAAVAAAPDAEGAWRVLAPFLVAPSYRFARLLVEMLPLDRWRELGQAVAELIAGGRDFLAVDSFLRLAVLLGATGSRSTALRHLSTLESRAVSPWSNGIRAALALSPDPEQFPEMLTRMTQGEADLATSVDRVLAATGPVGVPLVRGLVADRETGRLREAAGWLELASAIGRVRLPALASPVAGQVPAFAARYPAPLRGALALAEAAGAREAAERKLDHLFPDREKLRREIAAIDERLSGGPAHLVRRRANLIARLEAPRPLSAVRLARLAGEIERGARAAAFDRWQVAIEQAALAAFPRAFGRAAPEWLASRDHRAALVAVLRLSGESRRLLRKLVAARSGEPPWDLRSAPANQRFLSGLARRRVLAAPWLDGIGSIRYDDPSGALHLALEPDPLEVLRMGEHFGTCLSPGGENFYSALVNAVDINKRVVYGRDEAGAVVGRCLLALTDVGHILAFHPYCHRGEFEQMMRQFVTELAHRMRTRVVASGTVTPLCASRWYDDGPEDLIGLHDCLAESSTFRREVLTGIAPGALVAALEEKLGPLDGPALALVVALHELDSRPELVVPLLPLLDRAGDVPLEIRLRAIQLAERAGAGDQLGPRAAEHLAAGLEVRLPDGRVELEPIDRLAALAPSRLLAVVRAARRRLPRRERDNRPWLYYASAVAHRALGRTQRAVDELQRALAVSSREATSHHDLREGCQQALRELSRGAA